MTPGTDTGIGVGVAPAQQAGLAATGAGDVLGVGLPLAAGTLLAGTLLYRRARNTA
ncbi:hypothetical protein ACFV7Q_01425 [Streptomyces sp. NPDC059851]|uniref:hypothetical protein n=1 Tax=Streptomyces sp. NPDC059851 TaxID=3346971 RepID=UPI0036495BF4